MSLPKTKPTPRRFQAAQVIVAILSVITLSRLGYWQLFRGGKLKLLAQAQRQSQIEIPASRGLILSADGFPLVTNQEVYLAYAYLPDVKANPQALSHQLATILTTNDPQTATLSGHLLQSAIRKKTEALMTKFSLQTTWIALGKQLPAAVKTALVALNEPGIGFETHEIRAYPEASMAAHLLGFVGSNQFGQPQGYFGLEGYYQAELSGTPGVLRQETDVFGRPIVTARYERLAPRDGRNLLTHLDRGLQLLAETALNQGLARYQAKGGEVIIMEPQTGAILASVSLPQYDPEQYPSFNPDLYQDPVVADLFEPGSIFKSLVMAAAIEANVLKPDTLCDSTCQGPVPIGGYTIKTWNNQYYPGQSMTDVLVHSDNTGMVFVGRQLKEAKLINAYRAFGLGSKTGIDLEGETNSPLRSSWAEIDLATSTFGQGIAVTSVQMLTAFNALSNGGLLYQPQVVSQVISDRSSHPIKPKLIRRVISQSTAATLTQMLEASALHGEAQFAALKDYRIAGKTGTAQIPLAGHYQTDKTIASFIGFAPAKNPKFTMLVKLIEPQSSPWAAETAAPLWFNLADDLLHYLNTSI